MTDLSVNCLRPLLCLLTDFSLVTHLLAQFTFDQDAQREAMKQRDNMKKAVIPMLLLVLWLLGAGLCCAVVVVLVHCKACSYCVWL